MRELDKTVSGGHDIMLFGMKVSCSSWNTVLAKAAAQASSTTAPAMLGFLDERRLLSRLLSPAQDDACFSSLFLPSWRACSRLLLKAVGGKQAAGTHFSAAVFIPALLTYVGESLRVGIVGDDAERRDALCAHFTRHTPWHDVAALAPTAVLAQRFDLLIVDAAGIAAQRRIAGELANSDVGLIIMAGSGLAGLVDRSRRSVGRQPKFASSVSA